MIGDRSRRKEANIISIDEDPMEAYTPCVGVDTTAFTSCEGSARMSPRGSQPKLTTEPKVLGLRSAEGDAELGDGMTEVTLCWKL